MTQRNANRIVRDRRVMARVNHLAGNTDEVIREKREAVERELNRIAYANMADYLEVKNGKPHLNWTAIEQADDGTFRDILGALESVKIEKNGAISFKLHNKLTALEQLARLNGFDKIEQRGDLTYERMSESELVTELSRQANELGINITLSLDGQRD